MAKYTYLPYLPKQSNVRLHLHIYHFVMYAPFIILGKLYLEQTPLNLGSF